jgi:hypothetical protein
MTPCISPAVAGDRRYVHGSSCTWHGPIALAAKAKFTNCPKCPGCGGPLTQFDAEADFWIFVRGQLGKTAYANYEELLQFGEGKCFPDFDTLENAWRQSLAESRGPA